MGEVRVIAVSLSQLVMARAKSGRPEVKYDELRNHILELKASDFEKYLAEGCSVVIATLTPYQILYVPAGWLVAEHAHVGSLVYGCRKTVVHQSVAAVANMKEMVALCSASGKATAKMDLLVKAIEGEVGHVSKTKAYILTRRATKPGGRSKSLGGNIVKSTGAYHITCFTFSYLSLNGKWRELAPQTCFVPKVVVLRVFSEQEPTRHPRDALVFCIYNIWRLNIMVPWAVHPWDTWVLNT
eukprot:16440464-Heterocapsa_arctica.AAC.1